MVIMIDVEQYGGRRAYLAHLRARVLYAMGSYDWVRQIQWSAIRRVAFVCQGNICRSPYAGGRARLHGISAISFGIQAVDGSAADPAALRNASNRGVDLSGHRAARFNKSLIAPNDLVMVFEPRHLVDIVRQGVTAGAGITLIGIWTKPRRPHIQDPYGRSDRYFQQCYSEIDLYIDALAKRLAEHHAPAGAALMGRHSEVTSSLKNASSD
jgi:protein-tyrosine phosphatase